MDARDMMARRLREARLNAGYDTAESATTAFGWKAAGYRHHESGVRQYDVETAKRYGRAFKVKPSWLLGLSEGGPSQPQSVPEIELEILGSVAAGTWRETFEIPKEERIKIVVAASPFPGKRRFLLTAEGSSMDLVYPAGTILDCLSIFDANVEPESGDDVIVERVRSDGQRETTVKRFYRDSDNRNWLVPQSTQPEYQFPIEVGQSDVTFVGEERVQIIAYVIGSISPKTIRLYKRIADA